MTGQENLFEISTALQRLRWALASSKLPARRLQEIQAQVMALGDECYFHIGSLWTKPNDARAMKVKTAKLAEIDALEAQLRKPRRKVGARPKERVPATDMQIALAYLYQPTTGRRSVEAFVNEAIEDGEWGGKKKAPDTSVIARRIRRLIKRIELATE